jgi:predicted  nucleic acid-binding Zn-ribbon protein
MPEAEAEEPDGEADEEEEEEDGGPEPGEVEEINEETIKQLAGAAAGEDDDDDDEADEVPEMDSAGGTGNADVQIEKIKSTIDMLKEQNATTGDRLQTISQNMGEIRQMVHEQESEFSELEVDVGKMKDQLKDLEPEKLTKRLNQLQSKIDGNEAGIQKLEDKLEQVGQTANDARETLKQLGSMDNLIDLNKEFDEKLDEIKEAERYIERLASKSEKINIRINKKMSEYSTYKARVDAIQEKVNDMFKKLDEVSIKVSDAVKEDDLEEVRERMKEFEELLDELEDTVPIAEMSLPEPIVELREERKDIENFLDELEDRHDRGEIDESKYDTIREANEEKLENIRLQLVQKWEDLEEAAENAPEPGGGEGGREQSETAPDDSGESGADAEESAGEDESSEDEESAEDDESAEEATAKDDYGELVDQSADDVKAEVKSKNLDIDKVIEAEETGENRDTLIDWLESKQGSDETEGPAEDQEEEIDYDELMDQPEDAVKDAIESKDIDLTEALKAERSGQNRTNLLEWVEGKITEQG